MLRCNNGRMEQDFEARGAAGAPLPFVVLAALLFCAIAAATLCPQALRPHLGPADLERFGAYLAFGLCTAWAFPRRPLAVVVVVALAAFGLEAAQKLAPGRDAHLSDASVKALGGLCGAALGFWTVDLVNLLRGRRPLP